MRPLLFRLFMTHAHAGFGRVCVLVCEHVLFRKCTDIVCPNNAGQTIGSLDAYRVVLSNYSQTSGIRLS